MLLGFKKRFEPYVLDGSEKKIETRAQYAAGP
jgi:hypothetical protein